MHGNGPEPGSSSEDRLLGDEWDESEVRESGPSESGPKRFLITMGGFCLVVCAGVLLFAYMVGPRLASFHPSIARAWSIASLALGASVILAFLSTVVTLAVPVVPAIPGAVALVRRLAPGALWLGGKVGLQRDRLYHSFIRVHNNLFPGRPAASSSPGKIIMLLPRCLSASQKDDIKGLAARNGLEVFTVGGGEAARRLLTRHKPSCVIAVACERDLVSGIKDVAARIPVIGIPNQRPEGPCRNTRVDMNEVEQLVKRFL